jgi:hypothetical protein
MTTQRHRDRDVGHAARAARKELRCVWVKAIRDVAFTRTSDVNAGTPAPLDEESSP